MKAILLMFDSLNRHMLPPYGCDWTIAPNFHRLAQRTVQFDRSYVASMPCMPARRELHTGRCNFLHRSWGPLEPFDDSMPQLLRKQGIYTHLVSDHYHYWEAGGATYHTRYNTWDFHRGHEGDPWIGQVADPVTPPVVVQHGGNFWRQDWINRQTMTTEQQQPQYKTMAGGLEFIRQNHAQDNWLLHVETFDPHEPFFTQQKYKDLYPHRYSGDHFDWPPYREVRETPEQVQHARYEYAALLSMCDAHLGKMLDLMDELDVWKDTMLIVNTDHGFMLGEHESWAKCWMPFYEEVAHTPLFIWDPRCAQAGRRRQSLVQTIDIAPTLLDFFGLPIPADMQGVPLGQTVADDTPVRQAAIFGIHGGHINVTDGRHVYMRSPQNNANGPLYNYTLMPSHMREMFSVQELAAMELVDGFSFTKGLKLLKVPTGNWKQPHRFGSLLFDVQSDPLQQHPIQDPAIEKRMIDHMVRLMKENDAPAEQFQRMGLSD